MVKRSVRKRTRRKGSMNIRRRSRKPRASRKRRVSRRSHKKKTRSRDQVGGAAAPAAAPAAAGEKIFIMARFLNPEDNAEIHKYLGGQPQPLNTGISIESRGHVLIEALPALYPMSIMKSSDTSSYVDIYQSSGQDDIVHKYLASPFYGRIGRNTHGIHGFSLYNTTSRCQTLQDALARNHGEFAKRPGEDGRKNLFFTVFRATEIPRQNIEERPNIYMGGGLQGGDFEQIFLAPDGSPSPPVFVEGGTIASGRPGHAADELGEDRMHRTADLDHFRADDHTIKYARLGRLMPSGEGMRVGNTNVQEINFIGNGYIKGYYINMQETSYGEEEVLAIYQNVICQGEGIYHIFCTQRAGIGIHT